jgi:sigma-B regulation protein RsbU (phosphoserine phosphatase)
MLTAMQQIEKLKIWKRRLFPPQLPKVDGWGWCTYCSENHWPGGDFYDLVPLSAEQWLVFLGDASGHGGAAAVLAAMTRMVLHSCPLSSGQERTPFCPVHGWVQTPPMIAARLNHVLAENSLDEQFMTALLGVWKPGTARFDFVVAGQALPRIWRSESGTVGTCANHAGLPLGICPTERYPPCHADFAPGDALLMFTDGLIESRNSAGEMFGVGRVESILQNRAGEGAEAVKAGVLAGLSEFLQGKAPQDDITFLVLKRWN